MVTEVLVATGLVVTVKVAVVALAATVTLAGTCAAAVLLLDRVTTAPPPEPALSVSPCRLKTFRLAPRRDSGDGTHCSRCDRHASCLGGTVGPGDG